MSLNKTDLAFKKLINRQFTTPNRAFYQEVGTNTLEIDSGMVYTSTISSSRAAAISASVVRLFKCALTKDYSGTVSTSSYYLISGSGYSVDASNYNANFTSLGANFFTVSSSYVQRNFLSEKYGSQYAVEVRDSSGTQLSSDSSINWYFDYKSGVLHVADPSPSILPYSITASQYIGSFLSDTVLDDGVGTPEMYGAAGDGVTDDFLPFKHALISHSIVELGAKTYAVRGWIGMPSNRSLVGKGKDRSIIKLMDDSPYGYTGQLFVIQNTVLQNDIHWTGSVVGTVDGTGSVLVDYRDTTVRDESPSSPYYQQSQSQPFAGLGYWQYDTSITSIGGRRNILIEGLTVDCNFDLQARHASYNHGDNPFSASRVAGGSYYIPKYANRVRPTVHAIVLNGENIVVKDVKIVNYGYGCDAASSGPLNYADGNTLPPYNENFPLLLNADNTALSYTSSDYDRGSDGAGLSRHRGNYAIGCEVLSPGSTDLLNPFSNATAIYVTNQSVDNSTGRSSFTSEGGIFDSIVDPGERIKTPTASLWSGSYLDGFKSSSLKQTAGNLAEWFYTAQGSLTGSNGDVALSFGSPAGAYTVHMKKISGSWYPLGGGYNIQEHAVQGFSGYRMSRCLAKNLEIGFYLDSWRNNAFLDNNQMVDVTSGFRYVVSDIGLTSSYKNVVIKDNYIKLSPHQRAYDTQGHSVINYGIDISAGSGSTLRHIDNLVIEDNVFELPVSSSSNVYGLGNFIFRAYPRYVGFYLPSEVSPSGSTDRLHRSVSVKNNKFFNWNPLKVATTDAGELYGYNIPFYFSFSTGSMGMDASDPAAGPYPLSVEKFKREVLPNYIIEDNTYSDSNYPSTSSLVPMTIQITGTGTNYYYPIDQVNRLATVTANFLTSTTASIRVLIATGSLQGSSSYAATASYSLNGGSGGSSGYQPWSSGSVVIQMDGSGSLQDEDGNPIDAEESSSLITYGGSVSIGTTSSAAGYSLYVSRSIKIDGELSQGTASIAFGNWSHAEGDYTYANGIASHAEGYSTYASSSYSHAEGGSTHASQLYAHSEGSYTSASGLASHAEGHNTVASYIYSHAEGHSTLAAGWAAHAEGFHTTASAHYQHVSGKYNVASSNTNDLFIIGNGTSNSDRSNVLTVTTSSIQPAGFITPISSSNIGSGAIITGSMFYSGSNLFIFTGDGTAGGLTGWKTASLGG